MKVKLPEEVKQFFISNASVVPGNGCRYFFYPYWMKECEDPQKDVALPLTEEESLMLPVKGEIVRLDLGQIGPSELEVIEIIADSIILKHTSSGKQIQISKEFYFESI